MKRTPKATRTQPAATSRQGLPLKRTVTGVSLEYMRIYYADLPVCRDIMGHFYLEVRQQSAQPPEFRTYPVHRPAQLG